MNVTGSAVGLLTECAYWARDDVPRPAVRPDNRLGDRGTAGHKLIESHFDAGRVLTTEEVTGILRPLPRADQDFLRASYEAFKESRLSRAPFRAERAFAFDVPTDTSRSLVLRERRGYAGLINPAREIASTLDLVFPAPAQRTVHVGDLKISEGNEARGMLAKAQLRFNALSAARAYEAERAIVTEIHLSPDGVTPHQWEMGPAELAAEAANIRALTARIPGSEPTPGDHCFSLWCPLRGTCPATLRWQAALVPLRSGATELTFAPQTPEQFATAIQAQRALEAMAKWLKAAIDDAVDALPGQSVPMPDGRRYERRESVTRSIDLSVPGAEEFIREAGLGDAILPEATITRLKSAVIALGYRGGEVDAIVDKTLAGLDSIGAIAGTPVTRHEITGKRSMVAQPRTLPDGAFGPPEGVPLESTAKAETDIDGRPHLRI